MGSREIVVALCGCFQSQHPAHAKAPESDTPTRQTHGPAAVGCACAYDAEVPQRDGAARREKNGHAAASPTAAAFAAGTADESVLEWHRSDEWEFAKESTVDGASGSSSSAAAPDGGVGGALTITALQVQVSLLRGAKKGL